MFSGQYQGDILLTEEQARSVNSRNGITAQGERWPKVVPYVLSSGYSEWMFFKAFLRL